MKNINKKQLAELIAIQEAIQKKEDNKTVKTEKKSNPFGWVMLICLMLATAYFTTGCTYIPDCDQTVHGRGNIPASCRGVNYSGGK